MRTTKATSGSAIMRADVETSFPVWELGGFERLGTPAMIRKAERKVRWEVSKVARGIKVRVDGFVETDSGNIGHANAYYAVVLVGDAEAVSKVVRRVFGCDPADQTAQAAEK